MQDNMATLDYPHYTGHEYRFAVVERCPIESLVIFQPQMNKPQMDTDEPSHRWTRMNTD